jgi:uncharacterized protein
MAKRKGTPRQKHIPLRTCIACRETKPKRELARVVLVPEQGLVVDATGKLNGRGAYLCRRRSCWDQAIKRGALARALRVRLTSEDSIVLEAYADSLAEQELEVPPESSEITGDMTPVTGEQPQAD